MKLFTNQCQIVIQISTNYVSSELENLKSKELILVEEYNMGNEYELEDQNLSNQINQLIIHFRNYLLHNYLRKLVEKILQLFEKIFLKNDNNQDQLEDFLGNLIITLEYIQQKLVNYGDLQILKKQIDNLLNFKIQSTQQQVSPIILDLFNLQVLRDIYLTKFQKKYGIEFENFYKNNRKLSFDFEDENEPAKIDTNNLNQQTKNTKQSKKFEQNYSIIITPDSDSCIPSQQNQIHNLSEMNSINLKSNSELRINKSQLYSPQSQGSKTPNSNQNKNFFSSQLKINQQKDNQSIIEQFIQQKEKDSDQLPKDRFDIGKKFNMNSNKQIKGYDMFDEQSLFILRNYLESKYTSNKLERSNDLSQLINYKQIQ
ncbi:unnamed protein product [Paramecium pentaurelia]|uniref:Uncharacterized protein n=1 Tax=Paramecium pentaurelia TaxID=43138 RepID=A0A8S1U5J7_9CILI|nr:unnamed protein product [Paramecium pentaurelia]